MRGKQCPGNERKVDEDRIVQKESSYGRFMERQSVPAASPERTTARTAPSNWKTPSRSGKSLLIDLTGQDQKIETRQNLHGKQR
jgi:hypothetical protein